MNDVLYKERPTNFFDNLLIDVPKLYQDHPIGKSQDAKPNFFPLIRTPVHRIYRCPLIPLKYRRYFYHSLRRINLDQSWFEEFKEYWSYVLKGRPLWGIYDLLFLKNLYRMKFQNNQVPDTDDPNVHFQAWQRPELIYQLLHLVCRQYISDQLRILKELKKLKLDISKATMLEFGCAVAPITASLYEFFKVKSQFKIYIADIQTIAFHFAIYRFKHCSNVIPILLRPENDFLLRLDDTLDVIFCMAVFEHLNKPLETAKIFHCILGPGGFLFLDYIKSDGQGLDTQHGVRQRDDVLDFISENFDLVHGTISKRQSMGLTIVRKK